MIGTHFHQYQITAVLGTGGMGEVFRARDTRLNREVAVKVLPKAFASDADRLRRFEQEAKTLAALNHPNVLTVYDAGVHEGAPYLVTELLEGQTLREAMGGASGSALPVRKATDYALQIAHGLAAAHSKSIIHRDLKPENIFITKDGRVKILDFGLAKLQEPNLKSEISDLKSHAGEAAATVLQSTEPGLVLGTPAYMSPEQVRGEPADHRSDIFVFGCVLYEMLSGKRAFRKETSVQTMNAILTEDPPDLGESNPNLPSALDRIVRHCLEKAPARRFQTAMDLAFAIENAGAASTSSVRSMPAPGPMPRFSLRPVLPWAVAALAVAFGLAGWVWPRSGTSRPRASTGGPGTVRKFELTLGLPAGKSVLSGSAPVLSPDGQKLACANADGLWLRRLDLLAPPALLASGESITAPFWSPRSTELAYFEDRKLYRVPITGGRPMLVATGLMRADPGPAGGAWLEGNQIAFTTGPHSGLLAVSSEGGPVTNLVPVAEGDWDFHNPSPLPGGRGVLFVVHRDRAIGMDTVAVWTPGAGRKVVMQVPGSEIWDPVYSPTGHVLFHREDEGLGLWAFRFSIEKLERTGDWFRVSNTGEAPSVSSDGTLVYSLQSVDQFGLRQLTWVDRSGKILKTIGGALPGLSNARLSPDGSRIVASIGDSFQALDLWLIDVAGGEAIPFTRNEFAEHHPCWRPDGQSILFTRGLETGDKVLAKPLAGGAEELVTEGTGYQLSRSGRYLLVSRVLGKGKGIRGYIDMANKPPKLVAFPEAFQSINPVLSPDERLLAYQSKESGHTEVYLVDFPAFATVKSTVSRGGGQHPEWNPNGTELFYIDRNGRALMSARLKPDGRSTEEPTQLFELPSAIHAGYSGWPSFYDVAPDGQRFLMLQKVQDKSGVGDTVKPDVVVVQNWIEEFPDKK